MIMTPLTKVVFGKNSDRPEGEVQEVVEVGCLLQLVYCVFVVVHGSYLLPIQQNRKAINRKEWLTLE